MGRYDWCINTNEFNNINNIISNLNYFSLAPAVRFLDEGFLSSATGARLFSSATSTHFLAERFFSSETGARLFSLETAVRFIFSLHQKPEYGSM